MHKLDIDEPLLVTALAETIVSWLQIVQHVCAFVDHDVTVRIFGLVSRPSDVCEVPGQAIATDDDTLRLEPMVLEESPKNPPSRLCKAGRQFRFDRRFCAQEIQHKGLGHNLTQSGFALGSEHKAVHHRLDPPANRLG
jgi:hypothetical protein